jgi:phage terminase large subunit-like protein
VTDLWDGKRPAWVTPVPDDIQSEGDLFNDFVDAFGVITKDSVAGRSGSPLVLRQWQRELMRNVLAMDGDGYRHRLNLIGQPRKNGKSALGSMIAVYSLILGAKGGEVYSCAADKEQARIVFGDAKRVIEASPELSSMAKLYRDAIEIPSTGSVYRVLSAEAFTKEGLSPTLTLFDELHAQPNRELFDVMSLAMGARGKIATIIAITTAGVKTESLTGRDTVAYGLYQYGLKVAKGEIIDPTFYMAWWEAAAEADWRDEATWIAANPGYGDLNDADDFKSVVKRTPEPEFRTKRCNQWVSTQSAWLPTGAWEELAGDITWDSKAEYVLGFDGSFANDSTAICAVTIPKEDELPQVRLIKTWEKNFGVDDDSWRVNVDDVKNTILDFVKENPNVREVACDPYRYQQMMQELQDIGLPMVEYYTSNLKLMIPATAKVYDSVMEKKLVHDGNPALSRHLDNCVLRIDAKGPRVTKEHAHSRKKIDNAIAFIIAFDRATAKLEVEEEILPGFWI